MERLTPAQYAFRNRVREVANDMRARMGLPPVVWPELRDSVSSYTSERVFDGVRPLNAEDAKRHRERLIRAINGALGDF